MITFGIVSSKKSSQFLKVIIESIRNQNIPRSNYEILIVGDVELKPSHDCNVIYFDESKKEGWITKKKNLITKEAVYETIVYMHDYIIFSPDWFKSFFKTGFDFDVAMCKIQNYDGSRFRDWCVWVDNSCPFDLFIQRTRQGLLPYHISDLNRYMYISGAFWVAKKKFMQNYPLNEELCWGQAEDVEWSKRFREHNHIALKQDAYISLLKNKNTDFVPMSKGLLTSFCHFAKTGELKHLDLIDDKYNDIKIEKN
jgi:hypothetical protein